MDMLSAVKAFSPNPEMGFRIRQGACVSVETGYTCTVTIGGDTTQIAGVRYMGAPPRPGTSCFVATDGYDLFVFGQLAGYSSIPYARYERTTNQSIADAGESLTFPSSVADPWTMYSAGTFTTPCDGIWSVEASATFAANATGNRSLTIYSGGTGPAATYAQRAYSPLAGTPVILNTTRIVSGAKGTAITVFAYQNSGGALNVTAAAAAVAYLGAAE